MKPWIHSGECQNRCLYIPHGSDETPCERFLVYSRTRLYIPHGSDETESLTRSGLGSIALYPTWFRWNSLRKKASSRSLTALYPTWFRWNSKVKLEAGKYYHALYPTWFRWNFSNHFLRHLPAVLYIPHGSDETLIPEDAYIKRDILYIPHGSDETQRCPISPSKCIHFISHMVQMKLCSDIHPVDSKSPLYPTWFRWNGGNEKCLTFLI